MRVKIEDVCDKATSNLKQSDVMNKKGLFPVFGAAVFRKNRYISSIKAICGNSERRSGNR